MSVYLQAGELSTYGVPTATPPQIQAASDAVDAYLGRPEGLIWTPDASGAPAYMAAMTPVLSFTASGSIGPGANVVVAVQGGYISPDLVGEVLIIDRTDTSKVEACVVNAVGPGSITLKAVAQSHSTGAVLESGLVITEERPLPQGRSIARASRTPLVRLISGMGRYAYGRRSQQIAGQYVEVGLLAAVQAFGGPPLWELFDVAGASLSPTTGEVWIPAGMLVAYYSDVRLRYVAGYPLAGLPGAVKRATASLLGTLANFPEMSGNIKKVSAGKTTIERFADSVLDADTKALLAPFRASMFA